MKKKAVIPIIAIVVVAAVAACVYIFMVPVSIIPKELRDNVSVSFVTIVKPDNSYEDIYPTPEQSEAILLLIDEYKATRRIGEFDGDIVTFWMRVSEGDGSVGTAYYMFVFGGVQSADGTPAQTHEHFEANMVEANVSVAKKSMFSYKLQNAEEFVARVIEILDPAGTQNLEILWSW